MKKLRVGVFMGGKSAEREVSFNSGRTVCDHLDNTRYDIIPIFQTADGALFILPWRFLPRGKISDFEHRLATQAERIYWHQLKQIVDFIYIAVHGRYAEDGILQGTLEVLGIPYLGSDIFASALSMDKIKQKIFLQQHNIAVAHGITVTSTHAADFKNHKHDILNQLAQKNIQLPYIVKPYKEGSSLGVQVVLHENELERAVLNACCVQQGETQAVLIEQKIEGMEFSCITLTDYTTNTIFALPPTEVVPETGSHFFDYDQKYMPGRAHKFTPARRDSTTIKRIQDACVATAHALGLTNMARIDGFVTTGGEIIIIDPNSLSGMGPASFLFREAAEINMSHTQLINHLIETELHEYGMLDQILHSEKKEQSMNNIHKQRVAVLLGGASNEKEISLESGRNITYKLSPHKYEAIPVFVASTMKLYTINQSLLVRNSTTEIEQMCTPQQEIQWDNLPTIADFVFIGLHGGLGENGGVQGMLEMLGVPYNGSSVLASSLCMDKFKTTEFLRASGFETPDNMIVTQQQWQTSQTQILEQIQKNIPFPVIIKPHDDGCSVLVHKATNEAALIEAIQTLFTHGKDTVLIEEFITGMELTVGVIGNENPRALPPSQAVAKGGILSIEEKFLPGAGENQTPAPLPQAILNFVQKTIENVYGAVGCAGYARIDCFYQPAEFSKTGTDRVVILEINTLPGMTPATCIFHQAAEVNIKPMDFVDMIVTLGFEAHNKHSAQSVPSVELHHEK